MTGVNEIPILSDQQQFLTHGMDLLYEREKEILGPAAFCIQRYKLQHSMQIEDIAVMAYNYHPKQKKQNNIELKFCVAGNSYCSYAGCESGFCKKISAVCKEPVATMDIFRFSYSGIYLKQFLTGKTNRTDQLLSFRQKESFYTVTNPCHRTKDVLDSILKADYSSPLENIFISSHLQTLLLFGLEKLIEERPEEQFSCRFLANEEDREKIKQAKEILLQRIGDPITIKELSRKVGTNECYLKKGFKEIFGMTVFDFYQRQRMEYAKQLLFEKGLSVTDVSATLGYSSISHFSTAFKKQTGLKPCELLLR